MKKLLLFATAIVLIAAVSSSCKKDKQTTAQKVQHNWTLVSETDNSHDVSGDNIDTTAGVQGDFINFNVNGTLTSQFDGAADNGIYILTSDTEISINGIAFTIKTLTATQFVLYFKQVLSSTDYVETTINLKR